ncbi:MAG: hypothetical protein AB8B85_15115 [Paracoccaceae bacterium]
MLLIDFIHECAQLARNTFGNRPLHISDEFKPVRITQLFFGFFRLDARPVSMAAKLSSKGAR